jgi:hypothetical protein
MTGTPFRLVLRVAMALSSVALIAGCVSGLPQRRPGSNVTLPLATEIDVIRALFIPCQPTERVTHRARAVVECDRLLLEPARAPDPHRRPAQKAP